MKRILIPCDFSKPATEAFRFGISLARSTNSAVTMLHVIDLPPMADPMMGQTFIVDTGIIDSLTTLARQKFDGLRKKYAHEMKNITLDVKVGPVGLIIQEYSQSPSVNCIVMGTHGVTGLREFFVGSTTDRVVRFSHVPVFAIRKASEFSSIKNIVLPTTFKGDQTDFMKQLKALQQRCHATLHLLHVSMPGELANEKEFEDFCRAYKLSNVTFNFRHSIYEQDGILEFAKDVKADLIAMATHGRKGLSHLLTGSVTESIVNRLTCPVWTYVLKKVEAEKKPAPQLREVTLT